MACGVGLATGVGVVLFNNVIHVIRHLAWSTTPLEATYWGQWARELPPAAWSTLVLPPTLGGVAVGVLKLLAGGFDSKGHDDVGSNPAPPLVNKVQDELAQFRRLITGRVEDAVDKAAKEELMKAPDEQRSSQAQASTSSRAGPDGDPRDAAEVEQIQKRQHPVLTFRRRARAAMQPVLKATAAAITLGSGASLGPEGPSVEIGRATAKGLGMLLKSKQRRMLALTAAGAGAGLSAGFNAPISGVFFAVETLLLTEKDYDSRGDSTPGLTIAMVLLASVLAATASQAGLGSTPSVRVPDYELVTPLELPLILVFGACCGLVSASCTYSNKTVSEAFSQVRRNVALETAMPALGGLFTGIVALRYPEVLYQGFGNVNAILQNKANYAPWLLLQILGMKIICTSVCRGSGLVGGIYAPSIFMGATLGSAFGGLCALALGPLGISVTAPQAYSLIGVAAMLAANCQVPLTAVLLLFELTRDYYILVPTLGAVGMSYWVASLPALTSAFQPAEVIITPKNGSPNAEDSGYMDTSRITSQLGMGIVGDSDEPDDRTTVFSAQTASAATQRRQAAWKVASGLPPEQPLVLASLDADPLGTDTASVQCALEENCVLLDRDTSMLEALSILDEVKQSVALVTNNDGNVIGVLTRERIVQALSTGSAESPVMNGHKK